MSKCAAFLKGVLLVCLASLLLVGCGSSTTGDTLSTGYYKQAAIKANGEFVVKDKVDDSKAADGGIYYYVELGKEGPAKDKVTSITAMSGGLPIDVVWRKAEGNEVFAYMSKVTVDYSQDGYIKHTYGSVDGEKGFGLKKEASVRYKIAQDGENKGKIERIYYYDAEGNNQVSENLAQAVISYTKQGQIAELSYLDKNGNKVTDEWGANKLGFLYDKEKPDVFTGFEFRDHNGTPIENSIKVSRIVYEFDKDGRVIDRKQLNKAGELSGSAPKQITLELYPGHILGVGLALIRRATYFTSPEVKYTYDDKHIDPVKISFLGIDGQPSVSEKLLKGVSAIELGYDDKDRINDLKFIGPDGQSISPDFNGNQMPDEVKMEYDDKGNISKSSFYRNGEPSVLHIKKDEKAEVAAIQTKYDEQRRPTEETYLDKSGNPTYRTVYGAVKYYGLKYIHTGKTPELGYLKEDGSEFKAEPSDIVIGSWKQQTSSGDGYTWVINKDGTMKIIRPNDTDSVHPYTISDVNISPDGTGTLRIKIGNTSSDLLRFKSADQFEMYDLGDSSTFIRQSN